MNFFKGITQNEVEEREKKKNQIGPKLDRIVMTSCLEKKCMSRRIKWDSETTILTIRISRTHYSKTMERLIRATQASIIFWFLFIYQNTTLLLWPNNYYEKTIIKLRIIPRIHTTFRILNLKAIKSLNWKNKKTPKS
jgi:hypothetical protein